MKETIDWNLCVKLANNKPELAKTLLKMFVDGLPETKKNINNAYKNHDDKKLYQIVHKLHGASCFCGVPNLNQITNDLEKNLKTNAIGASTTNDLIEKVNNEIDEVNKAYSSKYTITN